ncbi:heparinase II/III domain-containing protein [Roseateles sp. PN1]|uniref:heparinase II/III domain-containing protein n=1 Tax=Roseateles sp. PN1 TaxID=3137372 RepID=UPI0031391F16
MASAPELAASAQSDAASAATAQPLAAKPLPSTTPAVATAAKGATTNNATSATTATAGTATPGSLPTSIGGQPISQAITDAAATELVSPSAQATTQAGATATPGLLKGSGVLPAQASACVATPASDFIETAKPEAKRLWPSDCRMLVDNAPAFSWPQPADRNKVAPWTFVLKDSSGKELLRKTTDVPRTVLAQALPDGLYQWNVSYLSSNGATVTSMDRRFSIQASPLAGVLPLGAEFSQRVLNKAHPRVLPAGANFAALSSSIRSGELKGAYAGLLREADRALAAPIPAVPDVRAKSANASVAETNTYLTSLRAAGDSELRFIEALCYAANLTTEKKYRDAAVARIVNLSNWAPTGVTGEASQPQANRSIHLALSIGADSMWAYLTASQRQQIASAVRARLADVLASIKKLDDTPYAAFENTAVGYALESLLLIAGTPGFPESKQWLEQVWEAYLSIIDPHSGDDGSSAASIAYAWWGIGDFARTVANIRLIANVDMTKRALVRNFGDFFIAFTAPNVDQMNAFGDGTETNWMYRVYAYDAFRLYASVSRKPEHEWYWRVNPANATVNTYIAPQNFMWTGLSLPKVTPVPPSKQSWMFVDSGLLAIHNKPADSLRSSFFFRASDEGSYHHSHADQNSFVFVSKGKDLLISSGYYDYYQSPHHSTVTRATRYKNAVSFDGGIGQGGSDSRISGPTKPASSMMPNAKILNQVDIKGLAAATGDATLAYRSVNPSNGQWKPLLSNAVRSFGYFKDDGVIVIYDWLTSDTARRWELNYHAPAAFTLFSDAIVANNKGASACINHYGPSGSFSQTSAWDVPPGNSLPAQFHGRFTVTAASKEAVLVTVIREDCKVTPVAVSFAGTSATVKLLGKTIGFNQRQITLPQ